MSVAGFDLGDQASCIAVARKRGIDVLLNKESKRETPAVLSFGTKNRLMGVDAVGSIAVNPKNAVSQIKRLLGKKFSSPSVQEDLKNLLFEVVEGPNDSIQVAVDYLGERTLFTPEQLVAMLLVDLKAIANTDGSPVSDCVASVPAFFAVSERRAMLNATQITGINCLRLMPETTATALAYGIYKTDLPEKDPVNVVFVDVGYTSLQVVVVAFKRGQLKVLSLAWDRDMGGRDFDEVLFDHFTEEFNEKYKLNVRSNKRASFRLRLAIEKLKKVLSSIPESVLNVECLMDDVDVSSRMTRDLFEEKSKHILERVKLPLQQALDASGLSKADISSVEVVGSSSRVPALLSLMREVFDKEPGRTLNAKECVARGCALNCAMLSPIFRVRDFEVMDIYPYGIHFSWEKAGAPSSNVVFERNGPVPCIKSLTFYRKDSFTLTASYTDDAPLPAGMDRHIARWTVGPIPASKSGGDPKIKVRVSLNLHGMVSLDSATVVEEEEYEEAVPVKKQASKVSEPEKKDEPMADADAGTSPAAAANGAAEATPMETEAAPSKPEEEATEVVKRKRTIKTPVPVHSEIPGFTTQQIQDMFEKECQMALQDRVQEETNERKNALEAYIYSLRNKLADSLADYVTDAERADLSGRLEKAEDWLYDEGEDETKSVYTQKLEELLRLGSPIEQREKEANLRPGASQALTAVAQHYLGLAASNDSQYAHISQDDKAKVIVEANKALSWLEEKQKVQASLRKTDEPVLVSGDIKKKQDVLTRFAEPLMSRPAPPPPKKEEKLEPKDEKMEDPGEAGKAAAPEGEAVPDPVAPPPASSQPMES